MIDDEAGEVLAPRVAGTAGEPNHSPPPAEATTELEAWAKLAARWNARLKEPLTPDDEIRGLFAVAGDPAAGGVARMNAVARLGQIGAIEDVPEIPKETGSDKAPPPPPSETDPDLPNHPIVEDGILGCLLLHPELIPTAAAAARPEDFFAAEKARVFSVLCDLADGGEAIDQVVIESEFTRRGMTSLLRSDLIVIATGRAANPNALPRYLETLCEDARKRALIIAARTISGSVSGPKAEVDKAVERAQAILARHEGDANIARPLDSSYPGPPRAEAFHGPMGELVRLIEPETEADPAAILIQGLVMFGNLIGRRAHWSVGDTRHYANLYACVVGRTSKSRKGTGFDAASTVFAREKEFHLWAADRILSGLASGEAIITEIRDPSAMDMGVSDKRAQWVEEEFQIVMAAMGRDNSTLSGYLRKAWDSKPLLSLSKGNPQRCREPHVSVIAHITLDELVKRLGSVELANGFANRFLWCCARRVRYLPSGGDFRKLDFTLIRRRIVDAVHYANDPLFDEIPVVRTEAAELAWTADDGHYRRLEREILGRLGQVTDRASSQVMRLALIYALLDLSPKIDVVHLDAALAVWDYCFRSAKFIFGTSANDVVSQTVLGLIEKAGPGGLGRNAINRLAFGGHKAEEVSAAIERLAGAGLVEAIEHEPGAGARSPQLWRVL